jgi:hypothetical protein
MIKDLTTCVSVATAVAPVAVEAAAETGGLLVDTRGSNSGVAVLTVGAVTDGTITILKVQEGAESNGSDLADIPAARIIGTAATLTAANTSTKVGFVTTKRYVKVFTKAVGTTVDLVASGVIVLGNLDRCGTN